MTNATVSSTKSRTLKLGAAFLAANVGSLMLGALIAGTLLPDAERNIDKQYPEFVEKDKQAINTGGTLEYGYAAYASGEDNGFVGGARFLTKFMLKPLTKIAGGDLRYTHSFNTGSGELRQVCSVITSRETGFLSVPKGEFKTSQICRPDPEEVSAPRP